MYRVQAMIVDHRMDDSSANCWSRPWNVQRPVPEVGSPRKYDIITKMSARDMSVTSVKEFVRRGGNSTYDTIINDAPMKDTADRVRVNPRMRESCVDVKV